jgi:hypothetical protein
MFQTKHKSRHRRCHTSSKTDAKRDADSSYCQRLGNEGDYVLTQDERMTFQAAFAEVQVRLLT